MSHVCPLLSPFARRWLTVFRAYIVVPNSQLDYHGFWSHLDPVRLGVPRYQNMFGIVVWFLFLFAYSQAGASGPVPTDVLWRLMDQLTVREPLDKLDPNHRDLDGWEIIMYILALSFSFQGKYFGHSFMISFVS